MDAVPLIFCLWKLSKQRHFLTEVIFVINCPTENSNCRWFFNDFLHLNMKIPTLKIILLPRRLDPNITPVFLPPNSSLLNIFTKNHTSSLETRSIHCSSTFITKNTVYISEVVCILRVNIFNNNVNEKGKTDPSDRSHSGRSAGTVNKDILKQVKKNHYRKTLWKTFSWEMVVLNVWCLHWHPK